MGFGGPVWHASVKTFGWNEPLARAMAVQALKGVGGAELGEWHDNRSTVGVYHIRRRLSDEEAQKFSLVVRDIRGTDEERKRFANLLRDVPPALGRAIRRMMESR